MAGEKIAEGYIELRARMSKFESQLKSAEVMTGKSVSKMQAKFKALAPTFRKVGIGMAVAGGAITAALGLTIKSAISFNKEMANIATLIPGATKRVIELKGAIRTMAVDVGKATADLAGGAYEVISAFGDTADTVAILEIAAKAATAGVATTRDAIGLLSAVTKGYGDTSKEAVQKVSDLAFMTVKLGQTDFPQLKDSIGRVTPLTAELGVSQEELFAVMATGTGVTGKAAEVSTQLRGIMQSLMSPTADMAILFEDMGFRSGKAMLAEKGLAGSLEIIKSVAEASNTPLQKYISSIEGQTLALALTGTQADTYKEKLAAMMDVTDMSNIAFREQTQGINATGFAFEQAKIRISVLGQEIGDRLLPMITPLIEKITALVGRMSDWAKEHSGISTAIVKFMAVLGPLLIGLGGLLVVLPGLVALAPMVGAAFHIMLGPIGLITAAIAAAVAAFLYFYKTNKKFAAFINNIGAYIKAFVLNAWNRLVWLKNNWWNLWKTLFLGIGTVAKNAFDNLITIFKWIGNFISGWGKWLGANFFNVWKNMFSAVSTGLKNFGNNIVAQLGWLGKKMNPKNWFKKVERPDWTPIFEGFEAVWTEMPKIAELNLKKLTTGIKNFMEPLPKLVEPVLKAITEGAEETNKAIESMTTATSSYITTYDELLKLRGKDKELTEEEKKRIKELEEAQKAAQEEIANIRKISFEEWQAQNEARTKELYDELDKQKKIQKDAKDKIAEIRTTSFEDWKKKNETRTEELYAELATQKQIEKDAKDEIVNIRKMSFEEWKKQNEARTKELYAELAIQKQIQQDAKDEITDIRKLSFEDWQEKNEARTKELYDELATQKQIEQDAKDEIINIRKMSFKDWKKKNEARTKELYKELAKQKKIQKDATNEIKKIRAKSFEDWKKKNKERIKKFYEMVDNISAAARDWYSKMEKYTGDFTEFTKDELIKIEAAYQDTTGRIKQNWASAFEGFTTELWVTFKTIALEKLGLLGDVIVAFVEIVKGNLTEGVTSLGAIFGQIAAGLLNSFLGLITKTDAFKKIMEILNPVIQAATNLLNAFLVPFLPIIEILANALTPVLKALTPVFKVMGMILGTILVPILKLLWPVFKLVAIAVTYFGEILAFAWKMITKIFGVAGFHAAEEMIEAMKDARKELWDMSWDLDEAADATDDNTQATKDETEAKKDETEATREESKEVRNFTTLLTTLSKEVEEFSDKLVDVIVELQKFDLGKLITSINFENYVTGVNLRNYVTGVNLGNYVTGVNLGDYVSGTSVTSAQIGIPNIPRTMPVIVHREEAILNPSQAREWRAGGAGGGTQITYERGAIRMTVMGGINQQVDLEEAMDYLARKQAREMEKV